MLDRRAYIASTHSVVVMMSLDTVDDPRRVWPGEVVFDWAAKKPLSSPLVVASEGIQPLRSYDTETYAAVRDNQANTKLNGGTRPPDDTPCVECAFLEIPSTSGGGDALNPIPGDTLYTYPTYRLARARLTGDGSLPQHPSAAVSAAYLLRIIEDAVEAGAIETVEDVHVALMDADIDGEVFAAASKIER